MGLIEGLTAILVSLGMGYIVYASIKKKNPRISDIFSGIFGNKLVERIQKPKLDGTQQIWKERRSQI